MMTVSIEQASRLRHRRVTCAAASVLAVTASVLTSPVSLAQTSAPPAPPANVWAWGNNTFDQLAENSSTYANTPVAGTMPAGASYSAISAGYEHSAAIDLAGNVWAWGSDACGQLGDGVKGASNSPAAGPNSPTPVRVPLPAGVHATAIAAGAFHTLALDSAGHAWAWGTNGFGELGNGTNGTTSMSTGDCSASPPVAVTMPAGVTFTAIAAGGAESLALDSTGHVWKWGWATGGDLGANGQSDVPVAITMPPGVTFTAIAAGWEHNLALDSTGRAWSWGSNSDGQLGNGGTSDSAVPTPVVPPPGGASLVALAAGDFHSVALDSAGNAWAWGENTYGQLGNGTTINSTVPTPVTMPPGTVFSAISAGAGHTVALDSAGRAWSWGAGLGNGSTGSSPTPVAVSMPPYATISAVAAGYAHTLALRPAATPPSRYTAVTPTRLCDTRPVQPGVAANQCNDGQPRAAGPIGPAGTLTIDVCGGAAASCTVNAVVVNVTVTGPTAASYLTAYPTDESRPTASNLNYVRGQTVANLIVVKVGTDGHITLYNNTGSADVVVDLEGTLASASSGPGLFTPVVPQRVCDTRPAQPTVVANQCDRGGAGASLGPNGTMTVQLTGLDGIPTSGVSAVALNLTATDTTSSGFLTAWAAGASQPVASNVNWTAGQTVPNRVIVPVNKQGQVSLYNAQGLADVVIDVDGWYGDGTESPAPGATTSAVTPTRICDSRAQQPGVYVSPCQYSPAGNAPRTGEERSVTVTGGVVPVGAKAVVLNVTITGDSSPGYLTVWPSDASQPTASDLNWAAGQTVANLVLVKLSASGQISLFVSSGSPDVIIDVLGFST